MLSLVNKSHVTYDTQSECFTSAKPSYPKICLWQWLQEAISLRNFRLELLWNRENFDWMLQVMWHCEILGDCNLYCKTFFGPTTVNWTNKDLSSTVNLIFLREVWFCVGCWFGSICVPFVHQHHHHNHHLIIVCRKKWFENKNIFSQFLKLQLEADAAKTQTEERKNERNWKSKRCDLKPQTSRFKNANLMQWTHFDVYTMTQLLHETLKIKQNVYKK